MVKRRAINCAEQDVVSRVWRHRFTYLQRAGVTSKIKRKMRRRERREGKREANA